MNLKAILKNPYSIAVGGTVIANYISAKANNLSLVELFLHQINIYSWVFITTIGCAIFLLLMLIKKNREYKRTVEDTEKTRLHQIEVENHKMNSERESFLNRQRIMEEKFLKDKASYLQDIDSNKSTLEKANLNIRNLENRVVQLTNEVENLTTKNDVLLKKLNDKSSTPEKNSTGRKNSISMSEFEEMIDPFTWEAAYVEFKKSPMYDYFDDIIKRAHALNAFSDMDAEVVFYYKSQKIISQSKQKPFPDCYDLTPMGEDFAGRRYKEKYSNARLNPPIEEWRSEFLEAKKSIYFNQFDRILKAAKSGAILIYTNQNAKPFFESLGLYTRNGRRINLTEKGDYFADMYAKGVEA